MDFDALAFPEHFAGVADLLGSVREDGEPLRAAPTYQLNGLIQSLASDLSVMRRGWDRGVPRTHGWLYHPAARPNPLPERVLTRLLEFWITGLSSGDEYELAARRLLDRLSATPPQWSKATIPLLRADVSSGGTAAPTSLQYVLLADHFARRIQQLPPFRHGGRQLRFRAVARGPRQQGAELMSQPLDHDFGGRTSWFSVYLHVTVHTVPFDPLPKIHLHTGIRRWATHPDEEMGRLKLGFGRATSVYLRPTVPWLPQAPVSDRYGVAQLMWDREAERPDWRRGGPAHLLNRVAGTRRFPGVDELLSDPEPWLRGNDKLEALVVHSTAMGKHDIATGLMSQQRSKIIEWAQEGLFPELRRVPDLVRSDIVQDAPANVRRPVPKSRRDDADAAAAQRLRQSLGALCAHRTESGERVFEARLLWQSQAVRDSAINALIATLGLTGDGGAGQHGEIDHETSEPGSPVLLIWESPELTVRLRCLRLGPLGGSLGVNRKSRTKRQDRLVAIGERRKALEKFLAGDGASVALPTLSFVEIPRRRSFAYRGNDPKFAIRLGCADAGVFTQFIADRGPQRDHRARSSWLDGFRQAGATTVPLPDVPAGLPADTQYLALWMASTRRDSPSCPRRKLPVAVLVRPGADEGEHVLGWDPEAVHGIGGWTTYPRLLTRLPALARVAPEELDDDPRLQWVPWSVHTRDLEKQRETLDGFLQAVLRSPEVVDRPTVLMAHSQNARQQWTWLQDGVVRKDLIRTGIAPPSGIGPGLKLVRVRTNDQRETGTWWGVDHPDEVNGYSKGLWKRGDQAGDARVFYSTASKASTAGKAAAVADKLGTRPMRTGANKGEPTTDIGVPGWNPSLVEFAVLACEADAGDDPESIAMALHQFRQAPDHLDWLRLPLPLHLARHAQEYVLPVAAADEEDPEQAPEVVEPSALVED
ncbi:hypothetical protein ADL03_42340 [Nocardia sp. NRRL S-836]|nr:hypothetical protein ADL03_42340 [Nocardia sp. NRRL S-836]